TSVGCVGFADVHADLKEIGMPEPGDLVEIHGRVRLREVEREVVDETTGQTSTETTIEHSIYLSGLEYMDVDDPDRDAEGEPELSVGRMLADGIAAPASPPGPPGEAESGSSPDRAGGLEEGEEVFDRRTSPPGGRAPEHPGRRPAEPAPERGRATATARAPSAGSDDGAGLAEAA